MLKLTTLHRLPGAGRLVRNELFFDTGTFESVEDLEGLELPGNTHLRSTSGATWDLEEEGAERLARVIVYVNEVPLPIGTSKGVVTVEQVEEFMRKDQEASEEARRRELAGTPKKTTLVEVDEMLAMAWTDASNLPASETKEELCRRMRHAADYLDKILERA